jgi:RNA polymerase sigma-70 factor (ECF subfamily)
MPPLLAAAPRLLTLDELVRRARSGDAAGIGGLYDRYAADLYRAAFRVTASPADAEDVVHDLFVGLPAALARYEDQGHLDAWLTRLAVRLALMRLRGERRRHLVPAVEARDVAATGRTDARVELSEMQQAVLALPDGLRVVLVLKQVHGYSHEEIGAWLGISTGASRVRLTRALESLRHALR